MATTTIEAPPIQVAETYQFSDMSKKPVEDTPMTDIPPEDARSEPRMGNDVYFKIFATGLSFFVSGINDGSTGPLLPYFIREYGLSTALVSVVYVIRTRTRSSLPKCWI